MTKKLLDIEREFELPLGRNRSFSATPAIDGKSVVLVLEDPDEISVVQVGMEDLDQIIEGLQRLRV